MPFVAVLDTCVLVPFGLRNTLLHVAEARLFRPVWSDDILRELRDALAEVVEMTDAQWRHLATEMQRAFPDATAVNYQHLIPVLANDEGDRHVLAAAIVSKANAIVTSDRNGFPAPACDPYGIEVLSPDDFLTQRLDLDPSKVLGALHDQAANLRAPRTTLPELLDRLEPRLPGFVKRARGYVG